MKKHELQEEYNPHLRAEILQAVDNQIAGRDEDGQPLTTAITDDEARYKTRLEGLGGKPVTEKSDRSEETKGLLRAYFDAFSNLYGIIPLYRALRIIQKQNPELALTEEQFLSFVGEIEEEEHFYGIFGQEDIYSDVDVPTPPMKREIIAEYLYDYDFEGYDEMRGEQENKPFYIPEKEELLKYQDNFYVEETAESLALGAFLRDKLKLKRADDISEQLRLEASMGEDDPEMIIGEVKRMSGRSCLHSMEEVKELLRYYSAMLNNTRLASNRGFTPNEMQERLDGSPPPMEFGPGIVHPFASAAPPPQKAGAPEAPERTEQKKPGRNDPCPCGSGKKYKRCCGR